MRRTVPPVLADLRAPTFGTAHFDLAIAARVLCHIPDIEPAFREFPRCITSGGGLIVTDLDEEHDSAHTRISTPRGTISIKTWKRSAQDLIRAAQVAGWHLEELRQLCAVDCRWLPPHGTLSSIDRSSTRPIFNLMALRRC